MRRSSEKLHSLEEVDSHWHADDSLSLKANNADLASQSNWQLSANRIFNPLKTCAMLLLAFNPGRGSSFLHTGILDRRHYPGQHIPVMLEGTLPTTYALAALPSAKVEVPKVKEFVKRPKKSFVTAAVAAVGPAVVRIDTERFVNRQLTDAYMVPGVPMEDPQRKLAGYGSGLIMSEDGLLLTNAHVVKNAGKVTVTLTDGRALEGSVIGADDYMDLAVVKIPTESKLPTAPVGRSPDVEVGDYAIAIGNAAGLSNTVTRGIVSSLSRSSAEIGLPNEKVTFLQTDAAINPGNSGGPLVNEFGEVIGINTAVKVNANGIGFAIPIDTAEKAMKVLAVGQKIPHSYIGVSLGSVTVDLARQNNEDPNSNMVLPEVDAAIILRVGPESPAASAGFRKFDVIQEINGRTTKTAAEVQMTIDNSEVGQQLKVKLVRQKKPLSLVVTTADLNQPREAVKKSPN